MKRLEFIGLLCVAVICFTACSGNKVTEQNQGQNETSVDVEDKGTLESDSSSEEVSILPEESASVESTPSEETNGSDESSTVESEPVVVHENAEMDEETRNYFSEVDPVPREEDESFVWSYHGETKPEGMIISKDSMTDAKGTTLFTDPYGRLHVCPIVWHGCIFFTASETENTNGIYRLYLPTGYVELLQGGFALEAKVMVMQVLSNVEFVYRDQTVLNQRAEEEWLQEIRMGEDTAIPKEHFLSEADHYMESNLSSESRRFYEGILSVMLREENAGAIDEVYCNTLTGEVRKVATWPGEPYGGQYLYPDGTLRSKDSDAYRENGNCWWLDDYWQN